MNELLEKHKWAGSPLEPDGYKFKMKSVGLVVIFFSNIQLSGQTVKADSWV